MDDPNWTAAYADSLTNAELADILESLSGCIPRSLLRAFDLMPGYPNTPQLAAGIFYLSGGLRR